MNKYDDWKTSPPESKPVGGRCAQCNEEIMEGEQVYMTQDLDLVHEDCWKDYSLSILGASLIVAALHRPERDDD
jgi:hypothetical protein